MILDAMRNTKQRSGIIINQINLNKEYRQFLQYLEQEMSIYKNLGSIRYITETESAEIFETNEYFLIQTKYQSIPRQKQAESQKRVDQQEEKQKYNAWPLFESSSKILEQVANKFNQMIKGNLFCLYSEFSKMPSLLINKNSVQFGFLNTSKEIQHLCLLCKTLIKTAEVLGISSFHGTISQKMFIKNLATGQYIYLHIPKLSKYSQVKQQSNSPLVKEIIQFLETTSQSKLHIPNKLLMSKIKKCTQISQMKQQIEYFQKVYEIGSKKFENTHCYGTNQSSNVQNLQEFQKNHRTYRKRSKQFHQQKISFSNQKKFCQSQHKSQQKFFKSIDLSNLSKNFHQAESIFNHNSTILVNRGKISKAIHSKNKQSIVKSIHSQKSKKNAYSTHYSSSKYFNASTCSKYADRSQCDLKSNKHISKQKNVSNILNQNAVQQGASTRQSKGSKRKLTLQEQANENKKIHNDVHDQMAMKQKLKYNLNNWKERRMKNSDRFQEKPKEQKSLKRKHKGEKVDTQKSINFIQQYLKEHKLIALDNKQNQGKNESNEQMTTNKNQQISKDRNSCSSIHRVSIRTKSLEEEDKIQQIRLTIKNQDQQDTIRQNVAKQHKNKKMVCDVEQKRQSRNTSAEKQKEKTTRRNMNPIQIIEQTYLKNMRTHIQKLNIVGQCVAKASKYLTNLGSGDKYLWQLPAFLLYKQFYQQRTEIEENVRIKSLEMKGQKKQILEFLDQIQGQNKQMKQSLVNLLKVAMKKIRKYQLDPYTIQESKICLNMDFSANGRSNKKTYEIIANFIAQLDEMRYNRPQILTFQIQVIDAFMILKKAQFNFQSRMGINLENLQSERTKAYFEKRRSDLSKYLNRVIAQ